MAKMLAVILIVILISFVSICTAAGEPNATGVPGPFKMNQLLGRGVNFGNACTWAKTHQFSAILKGRDLDAPVQFCP